MRSPALGVSKGFQVRRNKRIESAMTDKELRKLKRIELLELLVKQAEETEQLREQLRQAEDALRDRTLMVQKAGTLAEAAFHLNGVFTAADQAAKDYLDNLRALQERQEAQCAAIEADARQKADQLLAETREKCRQMEQETLQRCRDLVEQIRRQVDRPAPSGGDEPVPEEAAP